MGKIEPYKKFFFICEGANTEVFYFKKLIDLRKQLGIHALIDLRLLEKIEEDIINKMIEKKFNLFIYDLIPGLDFLEMVKNKSIINYDGVMDCILVNGYKTNLGLITKNGFIDGEFLVDETTFKALCDGNEVLVNWANK